MIVVADLGPAFRPMMEADLDRDDVTGFSCGSDWWDDDVAQLLRSGKAWRLHKPPKKVTFLYCADGGTGSIIGFVNVVPKQLQNPLSATPPVLKSLHITYFAVGTQHQGQGHGAAMLSLVLRQAETDGFDLVDLYVYERNERAVSLYQKAGFRLWEGAEYVESGNRYLRMLRVIRRLDADIGN